MNKKQLILNIFLIGRLYASDATIYENGNHIRSKWSLYSGSGRVSIVTEKNGNHAVKLSGHHGIGDGFKIDKNWNQKEKNILSWRMKYSNDFVFYVEVETKNHGTKYIAYKPKNSYQGISNSGAIRVGLGASARDGKWHKFTRDIQNDLAKYGSGYRLHSIKRILVRGSGLIDNILVKDSLNSLKKVTFKETSQPLRNPLKGMMIASFADDSVPRTYVSLHKRVVHWNLVENNIDDGVKKVRDYSEKYMFNRRYHGQRYRVEDRNIKSIPIVILREGPKGNTYAPEDMRIGEHDNQTQEYIERINHLVPKLAAAWDNDPRIGFVYMGIHGTWGEALSPVMTPAVAKALGDSFSRHFHNKKVLVRVPQYFNKKYLQTHHNKFFGNSYNSYYKFGMFWDAFAWPEEIRGALKTMDLISTTKFWKKYPLLGETGLASSKTNSYEGKIYDYSSYPELNTTEEKSRHSIHDTLTQNKTLEYLRDYIMASHCSALSWMAKYDEHDSGEVAGAKLLQKAMGYRFVLKNANYAQRVDAGGLLNLSFTLQNRGSAPFYYKWPVEVSLLDRATKRVVWRDTFKHVDIRNWQPGDNWDFNRNRYRTPPKTYRVSENFNMPSSLKKGEYILALSILDPSGMQPAVRFAVTNYYSNGRTPLGMVGVGRDPIDSLPKFSSIHNNSQLKYKR